MAGITDVGAGRGIVGQKLAAQLFGQLHPLGAFLRIEPVVGDIAGGVKTCLPRDVPFEGADPIPQHRNFRRSHLRHIKSSFM